MTISLDVDFAGLHFINPFMLSSAPPTNTGEMIERAFEEGWGGAVFKTLASDLRLVQNVQPRIHSLKQDGKVIGFSNIELGSARPIDVWLKDITRIKKSHPRHILFASLLHTEGLVKEQWVEVARACEEAGVDGVELNFSCTHGMAESGGGAVIGGSVPLIREVLSWLSDEIRIPIMVKMPALVENLPEKVKAAKENGANAISAINTVNSLSGVDVYTFTPYPQVNGDSAYSGLSGPAIKPIGLRCVAQIASNVNIPISGIGGISNWEDAVQYFLVGASTVQVCSAVMLHGYRIIRDLIRGLKDYMAKMQFDHIQDFVGLALPHIKKHKSLSREYRVTCQIDLGKCVGCRLCYVACKDSGYGAIQMSRTRKPRIDRDVCDGCGLCSQICPISGCITIVPRTGK
jgi:dihydropyrimidine dehydrogenase (NAD+) subunit PreA